VFLLSCGGRGLQWADFTPPSPQIYVRFLTSEANPELEEARGPNPQKLNDNINNYNNNNNKF
jgi:hypothetical protein